MARKLCDICKTRTATSPIQGLCTKCYDYSGWENTHADENHEIYFAADVSDEDAAERDEMLRGGRMYSQSECLVCLGQDPADVEPVKGHSNGIAKSHTSHAECKHPKTKADRAKCRKARAAK